MNGNKNKQIIDMKLEKVSHENDWEIIRAIRNHPENCQYFGNQSVNFNEHRMHMIEKQDYYRMCVVEQEGKYVDGVLKLCVGFVGVVDNDIRLAILPEFKNMGIGTFMVKEMLKLYPNLCAKVKIENENSLKLFEKLGFKKKYYVLEKS